MYEHTYRKIDMDKIEQAAREMRAQVLRQGLSNMFAWVKSRLPSRVFVRRQTA